MHRYLSRSIKEDDKFKAIEKQFGLGPKRRSVEGGSATDKRPKEIRREIGKLDKEDWNLKSIEDKLISKKGDDSVEKSGNKVPKWSKAAFQVSHHAKLAVVSNVIKIESVSGQV